MRAQWGVSSSFVSRLCRLGLERQKSEVRGQNEEALLSAVHLLPSALCLGAPCLAARTSEVVDKCWKGLIWFGTGLRGAESGCCRVELSTSILRFELERVCPPLAPATRPLPRNSFPEFDRRTPSPPSPLPQGGEGRADSNFLVPPACADSNFLAPPACADSNFLAPPACAHSNFLAPPACADPNFLAPPACADSNFLAPPACADSNFLAPPACADSNFLAPPACSERTPPVPPWRERTGPGGGITQQTM